MFFFWFYRRCFQRMAPWNRWPLFSLRTLFFPSNVKMSLRKKLIETFHFRPLFCRNSPQKLNVERIFCNCLGTHSFNLPPSLNFMSVGLTVSESAQNLQQNLLKLFTFIQWAEEMNEFLYQLQFSTPFLFL